MRKPHHHNPTIIRVMITKIRITVAIILVMMTNTYSGNTYSYHDKNDNCGNNSMYSILIVMVVFVCSGTAE